MQKKRLGPLGTSLAILFLWTLFCAFVLTVFQIGGAQVTGQSPAFVILYFGGFVLIGLYFRFRGDGRAR